MDKYVNKSAVQQMLHEAYVDDVLSTKDGCRALYKRLDDIPAAYVQPVDRWISVNDRLPEAAYDCLVWYSCDTVFGKSKSWGIAHCSRCDWYTKHLDGDNIVVLYWIPLPEPPKDGDTI